MIERSPSLFFAAVLALLGVFLVALIMGNAERWSLPTLLGLGLAATVLFVYAALITLAWSSDVIGGRWMYLFERARRAAAITPASQLIEEISRLSPEHVAAARILHPTGIAIPQVAGPTFEWEIGSLRVPASFVNEYLDRCSPDYTFPVRKFSEGTPERLWATALVAWMVERRLATPSSGNAPARFTAGLGTVLDWFQFRDGA